MNIEIDDDIYALDLPIQSRVALATMRRRPRINNGALAKLLGLSDSGIRTVIRRFKAQGLVREISIAGTRQFKVLVGSQGSRSLTRQKLTKIGTPEIRQKVTDEPPSRLTPEERSQWKAVQFGAAILELEETSRSLNKLHMASFFSDKFSNLVQEIACDPDLLDADRTKLLQVAETKRNFYTTANHILLEIPEKQAPAALEIIRGATPEQLADCYERIKGGKIGAGQSPMLIDVGTGG